MNFKKIALLFALPLILASCDTNNVTSSTSGSTTSNTTSSSTSSEVLPNIDVFTTITEIFNYLNKDGLALEILNGTSFNRTLKTFEQSIFSNIETIDVQNGTSYSNNALTVEGNVTQRSYNSTDNTIEEETTDNYKGLVSLEENVIYSIVDYDIGKENDMVTHVDFTSNMQAQLDTLTSTNGVATLVDYYNTYLSSQIISGFDDIDANIDTSDGSFSYDISKSWTENYSSGSIGVGVNVFIKFNLDGIMTEFSFIYQESQFLLDEDGNETSESIVIYSIDDQFKISLGEKTTYDYSFLNVKDYFLIDFDVEFYVSELPSTPDYILQDGYTLQTERYVYPVAKDVSPIKALNTDLEIIESSNQDVLSISEYGSVKTGSVEGESIITITNVDKTVTKQFTITTKAPVMDHINAYIIGDYHYVGDTEYISIFVYPDNTKQNIEIINHTPNIVTVSDTVDEYGNYNVTYLASGELHLTVRCKENPDVYTDIIFDVYEKLPIEDVASNLIGTWIDSMLDENGTNLIGNGAKIEFFDDNSGQFTVLTDNTGLLFEVNKPYEFTYSYELPSEDSNYDCIEINISTITTSGEYLEVIYDINTFRLSLDGTHAELSMFSNNFYGGSFTSNMLKQSV